MVSPSRVAVVTGANKGIGLAIVRKLALQYATSLLNSSPLPLRIYLTARNCGRGQAALTALHSDPHLQSAKVLQPDGGLITIRFAHLDIVNARSIQEFVTLMRSQYSSGIDILINNAGVAIDGFDGSVVKQTLACNYYGTLALTQALLPHIRAKGRIVNMSSMVGKLNKYSPTLVERFKQARAIPDMTRLMEDFQEAVNNGTHEGNGWPSVAYAVSKAGVTGMSRILGQQIQYGNIDGVKQGVLLNCCCPGYVSTDMTKLRGRKTPDQGAATPVKLALDDIGKTSGHFWEHGSISRWHD